MDFEAILGHFPPIVQKYWYVLILALVGLIFFVYGLISLHVTNQQKPDADFTASNQPPVKSIITISVDVEGAVVNPGVYKLPIDAIIQDALVSSKGLSQDADREYVSKNINLAQKISDGSKIYIPKVGETAEQVSAQNQIPNQVLGNSTSLININQASVDDLNSLPGVGPVTSQKIINARPYGNTQELLDKKVVSNKVFGEIKDMITAY